MTSEEVGTKSGALVARTTTGALARKLEESARLNRFFSKLFGEALHLKADAIILNPIADSMSVVMRRDKTDIKSIEIKSSWLTPIGNWLADRLSVIHTAIGEKTSIIDRETSSFDFQACIRVSEQVLTVRVKSGKLIGGKQQLVLSEIRATSCSSVMDALGMSGVTRLTYEKIISSRSGVFLVSSPTELERLHNVAAMLTVSGLNFGGDLSDPSIREEVPKLSREEPFLLSVLAEDASDALLKLREFGLDLHQSQVSGALCQGFIPRTCPACARKTSVDQRLVSVLPPRLVPLSWDNYMVGRGCEDCGQRGLKGSIGLQSILYLDDDLRSMLLGGANHESLLKVAYKKGTRSLLEDGLAKVQMGSVTLEAVFSLTRVLPAVYNELAVSSPHRSAAEDGSQARGESAAIGNFSEADDQPLFSLGSTRKARAKPMILVVEDDPDQRAILEMVFKSSNYEVVIAENGAEGLKRIESEVPDLIVSDLMMPEMDGAQFVSRIKAQPNLSKIPVLILTVVSDGDKEYALLDLGADDYCEKTVQRKILLKRVENLLKRSRNK